MTSGPALSKAVLLCADGAGRVRGQLRAAGCKVQPRGAAGQGRCAATCTTRCTPTACALCIRTSAPVRSMDRCWTAPTAYLAAYVLGGAWPALWWLSLDGFSVEHKPSRRCWPAFNNIGPALRGGGPHANYWRVQHRLPSSVLTADMLLGRLEIFPILLLFTRRTWRKW